MSPHPDAGADSAPAPLRLLAVTAVPAERDAVLSGVLSAAPPGTGTETVPLPGRHVLHRVTDGATRVDAVAAGVGPAAAAACTATALTRAALDGQPYTLVLSAGICGGFAPVAAPVRTVVADAIVAADLGAETPDGFADVTELGFGTVEHRPPEGLVGALAEAVGAVRGSMLTVSTATGTAARAEELVARLPDAAGEAMEGFGVAEAAAAHGIPVLEMRTVSNAVGPRERDAWRIPEALTALGGSCAALPRVLRTWMA